MATTGIKRLDTLVADVIKSGIGRGVYYLDCYNQIFRDGYTETITTRVNDSNKFILEIDD